MRMVDIIEKKKLGSELTKEEIDFFVNGYVAGIIPDYQISALYMAIYFKGMTSKETADLTMAYVNSGEKVDLSEIKGIKVDKHSSGGVGDKISLIVIPLVASFGIPVAKMSGRGLGHTGGTIDKLESIPGFRTDISPERFIENVNKHKMAIAAQTVNLTPADKKTYALRDVTSTIDSIPLIAASIMSKKIASGADAIVLDVKTGSGAFMKTLKGARELAETMVNIGKNVGVKTVAVITNMDQPLGHEVGNFNEVREIIEVLKGNGARDEVEVALAIASHMALLGGAFNDYEKAYENLSSMLSSGKVLDKFLELVAAQGGDPDFVNKIDSIYDPNFNIEIKSKTKGYINSILAEDIGKAAMLLGAGRKTKEDSIDFCAGITMVKKVGDKVNPGDVLCILHTNLTDASDAVKTAEEAYSIGENPVEAKKYVYEVIL
ncbi:MAG: pyrimidine-nucleoside phosphorylase [Solirubrobacterales bacterium]